MAARRGCARGAAVRVGRGGGGGGVPVSAGARWGPGRRPPTWPRTRTRSRSRSARPTPSSSRAAPRLSSGSSPASPASSPPRSLAPRSPSGSAGQFSHAFTSAMEWLQRNKYFHVVVKGVERDVWKFVLLARFSPLPSYIINYALSATVVGFFRDFLLPTIVGCLPMILQNVSIVSLAGAAVAFTTGSKKSHIYSYLFAMLGIVSSILISWRIKQYSSALVIPEELKNSPTNGKAKGDAKLASSPSENTTSGKTRKRRCYCKVKLDGSSDDVHLSRE